MSKQLTDLPVQAAVVQNGLLLFQDLSRAQGDRSTQIVYSVLVAPLLQGANNLSELANAAQARVNLGLGTTGKTVVALVPATVAYATALTLDLSANNNFVVGTLTGNLTLTLTNPVAGASGYIVLVQDATGSRLLTLGGTNTRAPGGTAPVLSTAANAVDKLYWDNHDGATVNLVLQKDFR